MASAMITKCSGKDRVNFQNRQQLTGKTKNGVRPEENPAFGAFERMLRTGESAHESITSAEQWYNNRSKANVAFPAVSVSSRTKICLVSICSLLNATQPDPQSVAVGAMVDEDTPGGVLRAYERLGVRVIDLSGADIFPPYFNNPNMGDPAQLTDPHSPRRTPLPPGATVANATALNYPHFSSLPDSWYKIMLWNLTEYERVFYFDVDTLAVRNATEAYLLQKTPFAAQIYPHQGRMYSMQGGMMVLQPSRRDFDLLYDMWHKGDYPYTDKLRRGDLDYGDDDQHFFNYALLRKKVLSTPLHRFARCDNDKRGYAHCPPDQMAMYHKWPIWESERIEALWAAAQEGSCVGNRKLLEWRPPQREPTVAAAAAGAAAGGGGGGGGRIRAAKQVQQVQWQQKPQQQQKPPLPEERTESVGARVERIEQKLQQLVEAQAAEIAALRRAFTRVSHLAPAMIQDAHDHPEGLPR